MLIYNFKRIFKARGIDRPFTYLRQAGFSDSFATRIKNNRTGQMRLKTLERLCLLLECTPNDLIDWTPDSQTSVSNTHPMNNLNRMDKIIDINKSLNAMSLSKLEKIEQMINEID